MTRRRSIQSFAWWLSGSLLRAQELIGEAPGRIAPPRELINVPEVEKMAQRKLADVVYATIAGGDRKAFERITFRQRLMMDSSQLDVSTEVLGQKMFAPIIIGPVGQQRAFHPDGELATVHGAAAAKAVTVISSRSSVPISQIMPEAKGSAWYQVYSDAAGKTILEDVKRAVDLGCKAVCVTVGPSPDTNPASPAPLDWGLIDRIRQSTKAPLLIKGIMSPDDAQTVVKRGVQGIVVSNHGGLFGIGFAEPIEVLPQIADAVAGKAAILIDGGFRRGTDILKALAFGANGVMLGRPPMWGLAAYGADGVQLVVELLQSELARDMVLTGRPSVKAIDRTMLRVHRR